MKSGSRHDHLRDYIRHRRAFCSDIDRKRRHGNPSAIADADFRSSLFLIPFPQARHCKADVRTQDWRGLQAVTPALAPACSYSYRRATSGLTWVARRAGIQQAVRATADSRMTTPTK